jgi:hypothetical protein
VWHTRSIRRSSLREIRNVLLQSHRDLGRNHSRWIGPVVISVCNVLAVKGRRNSEEVRVCVVLVRLVKVERVACEDTENLLVSNVAYLNAETHASETSAAARAIWLV